MTPIREIYDELARLAPPELAEKWDNVGLLVDACESTGRVLVTLDITKATVDEAAQKGCGLIVSHHPVIFSPLKRLSSEDVAFHLVQSGISAICMHTNLDAAEGGVNDVLAGLFDLQNAEVFAEGCGRVGEIPETTALALAQKAQSVLHASVKLADAGRPVRRLALISGAGGSMFEDALAVGADCLLTGEANHHAGLDAVRLGMSIIAAGHYSTEVPVVAALAKKLRAAFPELEVLCTETGADPFLYI